MSTEAAAVRYPMPTVIKTADILAKGLLVLLLLLALVDPDGSNLRNKAAEARAIGYPLASFTIPMIWLLVWKERASFPWLPDLLVTLTCFTDILGNRMDLYDKIVWFDDLMHFANTGLIAAAVILLTLHRTAPRYRVVERALAVGATAAIAWEVAEYYAFINGHAERAFAYTDTLSDLGLGVMGSVVAALVIHALWSRGHLSETAPQLEHNGLR
ncbi:hypothetical protein ASE01_16145 [Nocardioides sp. Root190]|uniref:hypothetical protein n=1 Tax=Nocardioides sp. Root190 TaxID=1736488 RepID=UPI000700120F|nr:hypothetical protein [Nocardioides sp. Root190]KRB76484.1 hypothetical protein ASE01_16145 [Nocardioides sp. Root190]